MTSIGKRIWRFLFPKPSSVPNQNKTICKYCDFELTPDNTESHLTEHIEKLRKAHLIDQIEKLRSDYKAKLDLL